MSKKCNQVRIMNYILLYKLLIFKIFTKHDYKKVQNNIVLGLGQDFDISVANAGHLTNVNVLLMHNTQRPRLAPDRARLSALTT